MAKLKNDPTQQVDPPRDESAEGAGRSDYQGGAEDAGADQGRQGQDRPDDLGGMGIVPPVDESGESMNDGVDLEEAVTKSPFAGLVGLGGGMMGRPDDQAGAGTTVVVVQDEMERPTRTHRSRKVRTTSGDPELQEGANRLGQQGGLKSAAPRRARRLAAPRPVFPQSAPSTPVPMRPPGFNLPMLPGLRVPGRR